MPQNRERTRTPENLRGPKVEYGRTSTSEQATSIRHLPGRATHSQEVPLNEVTGVNLPALPQSRKSNRLRSLPPPQKCGEVAINSQPTNQATSKMNLQKFTPASDMGARDVDIVPQDSLPQDDTTSGSERTQSGLILHDMDDGYRDTTTPKASNMRPTSLPRVSSDQAHIHSGRLPHDTPTREPSSYVKRVFGAFFSTAGSSSAKSDLEHQLDLMGREIEQLREDLHERDNTIKQILKGHQKEVDRLKKNFQTTIDGERRETNARERELERNKEQIYRDRDESIRKMQADFRRIESDRDLIKEKYDIFIRKQQEESFKKMESGRWLPSEETKVVGDLDRIKREMRSWAKGTSIKDMLPIQALAGIDIADLMKALSSVVLLKNNQLPHGLSTRKSPSLLLNALLAHDIYANVFQNPFFFLNDGLGHDLPRAGLEVTLDNIYQFAQDSNQQDAHIWRSQMLRLLLPPLRSDSKDAEKSLHSWTEGMIVEVSKRHASHFLSGSARYLISNDAKTGYADKLKAIYQEAATLSYMLWTRRTTMRCVTLRDMGCPTFDADSPFLVPHTLVRYDDHDDQLRNRPITVFVHPLLQVYGTDEAQDYDEGRVWAPAEVWLDSK